MILGREERIQEIQKLIEGQSDINIPTVVLPLGDEGNIYQAESASEGLIGIYAFTENKDEGIKLLKSRQPEIDETICKVEYIQDGGLYLTQYSPYFYGDKFTVVIDNKENPKEDTKRYTKGLVVSLAGGKEKTLKLIAVSNTASPDGEDHIIIFNDKVSNEVVFSGTFGELVRKLTVR